MCLALTRVLYFQTLTLQEALNVDRLGRQDGVGTPSSFSHVSAPTQSAAPTKAAPSTEERSMPPSFAQAAPLDEAELLALLMASPLYQKLEKVKRAVASGALQSAPSSSGQYYVFHFWVFPPPPTHSKVYFSDSG